MGHGALGHGVWGIGHRALSRTISARNLKTVRTHFSKKRQSRKDTYQQATALGCVHLYMHIFKSYTIAKKEMQQGRRDRERRMDKDEGIPTRWFSKRPLL